MKRRIAILALTLVGGCLTGEAGEAHARASQPSKPDVPVLGRASITVFRAIRAAEAGDIGAFKAQLGSQRRGDTRMRRVDLRPDCTLKMVTQRSNILVIATWACRAGRGGDARRGFVISQGKIAAITGEPIQEFHLSTPD